MSELNKYGYLITPAAKLHRQYFREMVRLLGIQVLYRAPKPGKHYTTYAEIDSNYTAPQLIGCIFENHPQQQTLKKLGWVSEIQDGASIISVDYDLPDLQQGCIFIVPTGLDNGKAKVFRVSKLSNEMVYPASITCEIVPEWEDTMDQDYIYDYDRYKPDFKLVDEEQEKFIPFDDIVTDYDELSILQE